MIYTQIGRLDLNGSKTQIVVREGNDILIMVDSIKYYSFADNNFKEKIVINSLTIRAVGVMQEDSSCKPLSKFCIPVDLIETCSYQNRTLKLKGQFLGANDSSWVIIAEKIYFDLPGVGVSVIEESEIDNYSSDLTSFLKSACAQETKSIYDIDYGVSVEEDDFSDQYSLALEFLNSNESEKSIFLLKELAEKNHIISINKLSEIYYYGIGCDSNLDLAFKFFKKSAELGFLFGMWNLSKLFFRVESPYFDLYLALKWLIICRDHSEQYGNTFLREILYILDCNNFALINEYGEKISVKCFEEAANWRSNRLID